MLPIQLKSFHDNVLYKINEEETLENLSSSSYFFICKTADEEEKTVAKDFVNKLIFAFGLQNSDYEIYCNDMLPNNLSKVITNDNKTLCFGFSGKVDKMFFTYDCKTLLALETSKKKVIWAKMKQFIQP